MHFYRNLPIKRKVVLVLLVANLVTLLLSAAGIFVLQRFYVRRAILRDLSAQAEIIAANTTAALAFHDDAAAKEILAALKAKPRVMSAALYSIRDGCLARYGTMEELRRLPVLAPPDGVRREGPHLELTQAVMMGQRRVGTLYLRVHLDALEAEFTHPVLVTLGWVLPASFLLIWLLSSSLQRLISLPILQVANTARAVAERQDYSVRVPVQGRDELGMLTDAFNQMLARIESQDRALHHRLRIEQLISEISTQFINLPPGGADEGIRRALGIIGEFQGLDFGSVYLLSEDRTTATRTHEWVAPGLTPEPARNRVVDCRSLPWLSAQLARATTAHIPCVAELPEEAAAERTFLTGLALRSLAGVPMLCSGKLMGFMVFSVARQTKRWEEDDLTMLGLLSQIVVNALERQRARTELEHLHQRLIAASRQAGMAEVATGVLHNVGNVLNSINVSTTLIAEHLRHSDLLNLEKVADLLRNNAANLGAFLTTDAKGRLLPGYILKLSERLKSEHDQLEKEQELVVRHVEHLKQIVAMQQSYARVSGFLEKVSLAQLCEDALEMNRVALTQHQIRLRRQYAPVPEVVIDRHKVLQILINLIQNARHALTQSGRVDKELTVSIDRLNPERIRVAISDNGIGIPPENLARIFSHGFTTRKDGHGFGLHSGANAARELGGDLKVTSDGAGRGAVFSLELPLPGPATATASHAVRA